MRFAAALAFAVTLAVAAAASGCHLGETGRERAERLRAELREVEADEAKALAAVEEQRLAYEARFAEREEDVRDRYRGYRERTIAASATRYHQLLADPRATEPGAADEMNRRIEAAAAEFRAAEWRAEERYGKPEAGDLADLAARRADAAERLARRRETIVDHYREQKRDLQSRIAAAAH